MIYNYKKTCQNIWKPTKIWANTCENLWKDAKTKSSCWWKLKLNPNPITAWVSKDCVVKETKSYLLLQTGGPGGQAYSGTRIRIVMRRCSKSVTGAGRICERMRSAVIRHTCPLSTLHTLFTLFTLKMSTSYISTLFIIHSEYVLIVHCTLYTFLDHIVHKRSCVYVHLTFDTQLYNTLCYSRYQPQYCFTRVKKKSFRYTSFRLYVLYSVHTVQCKVYISQQHSASIFYASQSVTSDTRPSHMRSAEYTQTINMHASSRPWKNIHKQ